MVFIVVAEALADKRIACGLADRVIILHGPGWIADDLEGNRSWRGIVDGTELTKWSEIRNLAAARGVRILGHGRDETGGFDYNATRKVINLCLREVANADALLLVRDMDRQANERRRSLDEAIIHSAFPVVLALPNPVREAWVLNGFVPKNAEETARHKQEKAFVGCDPCERAEEMSGRHDGDRKSPKRSLRVLTGGESEREEACWALTSLTVLTERGRKTGLADFIAEVESILLPLFN